MRLDKFLKVSRVIKRRTVANDACDAGHISVNGKVAKASYDVKEGDEVVIAFELGGPDKMAEAEGEAKSNPFMPGPPGQKKRK